MTGFDTESSKNVEYRFTEETSHSLPCNIDFEIPFQNLSLEYLPIGCGEFGQVFKGTLTINEQILTVAVKTTNLSEDYYSFRSLLCELKILVSIGRHDNIVNLIGTSTNIQRKLHIVMEYCANGSVHDFIMTRRNIFENMIEDDRIIITTHPYYNCNYQQLHGTLSTMDILQWAHQTARGMQYLQSKKIM